MSVTQCTSRPAPNSPAATLSSPAPNPALQTVSRQVFLLEPDAGTVCRILALYAGRGLLLERVQLERAAPLTQMLVVHSRGDQQRLRILVEKAGSLHGVIEAALD